MEKEIELENGLRIKIYLGNQTATVIKSEKVTGNVLIPRYVEDEGKKYRIISLSEKAFEKAKFDSLLFPKDSEVETFEDNSFYFACFTKLQIPPKLKKIDHGCFKFTDNIVDIEVSPKNRQFSYIENKYFVGKSRKDRDDFDVLYYARYDIEEAVIPPQIEIVGDCSFNGHKKLKSVLFPNNSKLKRIEFHAFGYSTLSKLVLPASLKYISEYAFCSTEHLNEIEVSPKNQTFSMINKALLVKKSYSSKMLEYIFFCRRDIERVEIPSYIKVIDNYAFQYCTKLKSVNFKPNSTLERIGSYAFSCCTQLKNINIPSYVKHIDEAAFSDNSSIESIEFFSSQITFGKSCFSNCEKLTVVSLPNATKISFYEDSMEDIPKGAIFKIRKSAEISGIDFPKIQNQIRYIEDEEKETKKIQEPPSSSNKSARFNRDKETTVMKIKNEERANIEKYIKHIRFLESRLSKYEEVIPFDPNSTNDQENEYIDYETSNDELKSKENNKQNEKGIFIDEEDESHHQIISQIGEGATSYAYKVIDERNGDLMCKKVLKANDEKTTFKDFQNIFKEFEVLKQLTHPCICETIGINPQEEIKANEKSNKREFPQYEEEEEIEIKTKKTTTTSEKNTTIAIFLKYHPMNLKECLERNILNNTLKAKLVVEIAFGMLHIHDNGMIHRDLKLENVMVNFIFEAQLIDFGLAHVNDLKTTMTSMTKGIGTLAYMSPEMSNEEEYDNKTDVYSFGVLLFVLFTRRFPKQSMKDKLTNQQIRFPRPSAMISAFCIELIKKCMSFEPSKRPSFDEILEDIFNNSFKFADEIESDLVLRRYRTLNRFRMINKRNKMNLVKEPSGPMKSNNTSNKKIIKKPVIIKPV